MKKPTDACLTAVNQVIGRFGNEFSNGIPRQRIHLSFVFLKNVSSEFVKPYGALAAEPPKPQKSLTTPAEAKI